MIKLKVDRMELERLLGTIDHDIFQKSIKEHWKINDQEVSAQSVCWLFCWAKTGTNSQKVRQQSRQVFDKIFQTIDFLEFDKKVSLEYAREARYINGDIEKELEGLLNGKALKVRKNKNRKVKYQNGGFESKKEFEKYRINKQNLKGFNAAERFLLRLELMDNGFYISPRTNLHCYYKDRYLFYLHDFGQFSIKIRQKYNCRINKGTFDYSSRFFNILETKIQIIDEGLSTADTGGYSHEIGNTGNADATFDIILAAMQEIALEIDNSSKEKQEEDFEKKIKDARKLTREERLNKLKNLPDYPSSSEKKTITYNRNQYVVAEVLERANGKCEFCMKDAPFDRIIDGTPFLEVHHIVALSEGGKDTIDNAIALCPNCHRGAHYGGFKIKNTNRHF